MNLRICIILVVGFIYGCSERSESAHATVEKNHDTEVYLTVLGIAQDGGYPHINNFDEFEKVANHTDSRERVVSLGLIDRTTQHKYIFEATPDFPEQLYLLEKDHIKNEQLIDGVFLTHAHMGHYTGLMHLGREALGGHHIPVYAMPKMKSFLEKNGPWSQLIALENIKIHPLEHDVEVQLSPKLKVIPFLVPHRDEFSETVGYKIEGPEKKALFIPDINKWHLWEKSILEEVKKVDYAFLDATFYADGEIPRPMSEVPHPFIEETVALFEKMDKMVKSKIIFIHFNHSNPVLDSHFPGRITLEKAGYQFAEQGAVFEL